LTTSQFPGPNDLRTECFNAHNTTAYNEMWSKARRSHTSATQCLLLLIQCLLHVLE
jgi:hypothetical protein